MLILSLRAYSLSSIFCLDWNCAYVDISGECAFRYACRSYKFHAYLKNAEVFSFLFVCVCL